MMPLTKRAGVTANASLRAGEPSGVNCTSTIDWSISDGVQDIPIEQRSAREVTHIHGRAANGDIVEVRLTPDGSPARNDAFDVTPARLVTGIITERGVCPASAQGLRSLYPDLAR